MEKDNELCIALLMKKIINKDGFIEYKPISVAKGYYDEDGCCFVDLEGTPYFHIIEQPDSIGFCDRENLEELRNDYIQEFLEDSKDETEYDITSLNNLNDEDDDEKLKEELIEKVDHLILENKLNDSKEFIYTYYDEYNTDLEAPVVLFKEKSKPKEMAKVLVDGDIMNYYYDCYQEFFYKYFKVEKSEDVENKEIVQSNDLANEKLEEIRKQIDVNKMFKEITSYVIDQDDAIKKILTAIWKQYNDFSSDKSRNILINGSTGVGKTQTFRILTKLIDVPCVITSATEYTAAGYVGKSVEDMLVSLIKKANYDVKKAERGILIIDEIDKISQSESGRSQVNQRDVQEALLKILEDGVFDLTINYKQYSFDTSKLMVVGMGSWSRIDLTPDKVVGFEQKAVKKTYKDITREDIIANGLIPELVGRFPIIVQMNELNYDSFLRILKSKNSSINLNKEFFERNGVRLIIKDDAYEAIAKKASESQFGARGIDEIVENALSLASYEIACNPEMYSDLIISKETIDNNENFKLVKKMN